LSFFTPDEVNFLQPYTVTHDVPAGYTKKYGTSVSKQVLVGIPSMAEIGDRVVPGTLDLPPAHRQRVDGWVTDCDTMSACKSYGWRSKAATEMTRGVIAMIKIKDDAPVDVNVDGSYVIRIPEEDFTGNLEEFLGFVA